MSLNLAAGLLNWWENLSDEEKPLGLQIVQDYLNQTVQLTAEQTGPALAVDRIELRGAALQIQSATGSEYLLAGAAGTGKSVGVLAKIHDCCCRWDKVRAAIVRKTRSSLTESALVTYEDKILPVGSGINLGAGRPNRHSYKYPNGSEIVLFGLDSPNSVGDQLRRARFMSTDFDIIYVQEAIEVSEDDWENLTTRLRNNRMPYQQLIGDTNPDRPTHWLKRRCDAGRCEMLYSKHEDNPVLYDLNTGWTRFAYREDNQGYIQKLDRLTGAKKERLRFGRWVQSEGVIYSGWSAADHVIEQMPAGWHSWPMVMGVDFGYSNPFVCLWCRIDPDGRLYLYREIYKSKRIVQDHAVQMKRYMGEGGERPPEAIICDHDAEGRATLERWLDMGTTPADKESLLDGINEVAERLVVQPDGKPRLFIMKDCLVERDEELWDAKFPTSILEEIDSYVWKKGGKKDEPMDLNNHGLDALRYLVTWANQFTPGGSSFGLDGSGSVMDRIPKGVFND